MNGGQYAEMFEAILSLREAVELGFKNSRTELRTELEALDDRWNRRFNALEARVEGGFAQVDSRFDEVDGRFAAVDNRFAKVDGRLAGVDMRLAEVSVSLRSIDSRLQLVEQR